MPSVIVGGGRPASGKKSFFLQSMFVRGEMARAERREEHLTIGMHAIGANQKRR
jgi:hypothetical protein